jgi:N-acylglucosamine 2-epimerase
MTVAGLSTRARRKADAEFDLEHLNSQILPWWYENGVDDVYGGVLTCFDNNGELLSTDKYTWSQGRWGWLMGRISLAGRSGLEVDGWMLATERAAKTADFLCANVILEGGVTAYQTTREGTVIEQSTPPGAVHTSVYSDLFTVLGLAGAIAAVHEEPADSSIRVNEGEWARRATEVLLSASRRIESRTAMTEPYPVPQGMTSLGEQMMLVNAASELWRATRSAQTEEVVLHWGSKLVAAARANLPGLPGDFALIGPGGSGGSGETLLTGHRTPGHILELLWFLEDAASELPSLKRMLGEWVPALALKALELGWDDRDGGLFRYVHRSGGEPRGEREGGRYEELVQRTWSTKLWWPQVEAIYATSVLATTYESTELWEWNDKLRAYAFATFPAPGNQEWIQIRDRSGRPLNEVVALPVKDPFHIARALLLSAQWISTKGTSN